MNHIKEIRLNKGLTQQDIAEKANVSRPYLVDLEKGRRGAKEETKRRIAEALGVTVEEAWGGEDDDRPDADRHGRPDP